MSVSAPNFCRRQHKAFASINTAPVPVLVVRSSSYQQLRVLSGIMGLGLAFFGIFRCTAPS